MAEGPEVEDAPAEAPTAAGPDEAVMGAVMEALEKVTTEMTELKEEIKEMKESKGKRRWGV